MFVILKSKKSQANKYSALRLATPLTSAAPPPVCWPILLLYRRGRWNILFQSWLIEKGSEITAYTNSNCDKNALFVTIWISIKLFLCWQTWREVGKNAPCIYKNLWHHFDNHFLLQLTRRPATKSKVLELTEGYGRWLARVDNGVLLLDLVCLLLLPRRRGLLQCCEVF